MVKGMNQEALEKILSQVPIGRLIEPAEVASLIGELFRIEAIAGDTFSGLTRRPSLTEANQATN